MKANRLTRAVLFLLLSGVAVQLPAQQSEVDRKLFDQTRAKAEKGDAVAQYNLGDYYHDGVGVTKDETEAVTWFRKAAEQGFAYAQYNLGVAYANGDGVTRDAAEAIKWYRKAADKGDAWAQSNLGTLYERGDG